MNAALLLGLGAVLAGVLAAFLAGRWRGLQSGKRRQFVGASLGLAGLGALIALVAQVSSNAPTSVEIDTRSNPFRPTPESLAIGRRAYQAHCQACHGADGRGEGPGAANLYPRPTDFMVHFASRHTHTDGRLFYWVTYGMGGTGMPGFKSQLSDSERWHLVNYLRTFTPADR